MPSWLEDISEALANLGGIAHYDDLYPEVSKLRAGNLPENWRPLIRKTVQANSTDSETFQGNHVFYSVEGIGAGVWGLRSMLRSTPCASDIESPATTNRVLIETYRILRDTELARKIKAIHKNRCQVCRSVVTLKNGDTYAEAHHIRPLGRPHNGPDRADNIIVLCPNHHVMFDYGAALLEPEKLHVVTGHAIGAAFVDYHNKVIYGEDSA